VKRVRKGKHDGDVKNDMGLTAFDCNKILSTTSPLGPMGIEKEMNNAVQITIPALDGRRPYQSRLSARSAMYTDLRILLESTETPLSTDGFRALVVEKNVLSRSSSSAREKQWKELRPRYVLDCNQPLFSMFWNEWQLCKSEPERGLTAYILFSLNDRMVFDLGTEWLYPRLKQSPSELRTEDVKTFLKASLKKHPEIEKWSHETFLRVVQHYMASIRDFGLATGKLKKVSVRPALYGAPIRLILRALNLLQTSPLDMLRSTAFRLLALDGIEVIDALGELNRMGELRFRIQGDIVEMDWDKR